MRRIVVLGGFGFFGRTVVERLRALGLAPLAASRRQSAEIVIDVEDRQSLRAALRPGDVVVDAVGPFQERSTRLAEAAAKVGFDLVDLADSLAYVRSIYQMRDRVDAAGIRVFTACSSVSAITAAMIRLSDIAEPIRVTGILVPATKYTAVAGTAASLLCSVGRVIRVYDGGELTTRQGWRSSRRFDLPAPLGSKTGYLFESADAVTLPPIWPSLQTVEFYVDTNVLGLNAVFGIAARISMIRKLIVKHHRRGVGLSRYLGRKRGALGYEIESADGKIARLSLTSADNGYITPVAPAVLVAKSLAEDRVRETGLIPPDRHVDRDHLIRYLHEFGINLCRR